MLTVKVSCNAGDNIEQAFKDAIRLAKKLDCCIEFDFNGVICLAFKYGDIDKGV